MATRSEVLASLASKGYTGPTSYTKAKLEELDAGFKKGDASPERKGGRAPNGEAAKPKRSHKKKAADTVDA